MALTMPVMIDDIARSGHFVFESGHHGDTWLDLDRLIGDATAFRGYCEVLARRLRGHGADLVCGPLDGGAFVAQWVAAALGTRFAYSRRDASADGVTYTVAAGSGLDGRRAVVVDDAINLGSATLATARSLAAVGCEVVALGSLLTCRPHGPAVGARLGVPQEYLTEVTARAWQPAICDLCRTGVPLTAR